MKVVLMSAAMGVMMASVAGAATVTSFDNFTPTSPYASWSTATITSGPTALGIQSTGFGGAYCNLPNVDGTGADTIQLDATVTAGVAGFIVALGDTTGHEWNYAWYGNPAGSYVFTKSITAFNFSTGGAGALDLANLDYIHIQVDPGAFGSTPYNVSFNDLQVISTVTPEPASLAVLSLGAMLLRRRR